MEVIENASGTVVLNQARDNVFELRLTGNVTTLVFSNSNAAVDPQTNGRRGQRLEVHFVQDATGGRTVTLPGSVHLNDLPLILSSAAGKRDVLTLRQTADNPPAYSEIARTLDATGVSAQITSRLAKSSNLGDLPSPSTARTNLGLAAVAASGAAGDIVSGVFDDARIPPGVTRDSELSSAVSAAVASLVGAAPDALNTIYELAAQLLADESAAAALTTTVAGKLAKTANLSDVPNPATARSNLGVLPAATAKTIRNAGSLALTGTVWADVDNALDLVLPAVAGDRLEVSLSAFTAPDSAWLYLGVVTVVGGVPVHQCNDAQAERADGSGVSGWIGYPNNYGTPAGAVLYTVQADDVSGGNVRVRLRHRGEDPVATKSLYATGQIPLIFHAVNLRQ